MADRQGAIVACIGYADLLALLAELATPELLDVFWALNFQLNSQLVKAEPWLVNAVTAVQLWLTTLPLVHGFVIAAQLLCVRRTRHGKTQGE